ncbi:unnamed protein product [Calypogeia fissa]
MEHECMEIASPKIKYLSIRNCGSQGYHLGFLQENYHEDQRKLNASKIFLSKLGIQIHDNFKTKYGVMDSQIKTRGNPSNKTLQESDVNSMAFSCL